MSILATLRLCGHNALDWLSRLLSSPKPIALPRVSGKQLPSWLFTVPSPIVPENQIKGRAALSQSDRPRITMMLPRGDALL